MEKISKIKEWVLINYRKNNILKMFNSKIKQIETDFISSSIMKYYDTFNNPFEWQIIDEILLNIDEKYDLNEDDMKKISFFVEKYVKIIIPEFKNSIRNDSLFNKKQKKLIIWPI